MKEIYLTFEEKNTIKTALMRCECDWEVICEMDKKKYPEGHAVRKMNKTTLRLIRKSLKIAMRNFKEIG